MTVRTFLTSVAALGATTIASSAEATLNQIADEQFAFATKQFSGLLKRMEAEPSTHLPRSFVDGKVAAVDPEDWTSGFFPGSLWFVYEATGDARMKAAAEQYTSRVERIKDYTGNHDVGFMLGCSYGQGYRITGKPAYMEVLVQGARSLATRYSPKTGLIQSWDSDTWKFPVIVDNMMNLELLVLAAENSGDKRLREIAVEHADKTLANHYRPDGSSFHLVDYDPETGGVLKKQTVQGFSDPSSWARGQAWGLYGYIRMAGLTGNAAYLQQARKIADFLVNHPRLPKDGIPYWDFDASNIPDAVRDASAGALMACGLLELADHLGEAEGAGYRAMAEKQLRSLSTSFYRAGLNENGNFLIMHCVGHMPEKSEVDVPLAYADYYFLEGLSRYATKAVKAKNTKFGPTRK